jgi:hypothetical protein
MKLPDDLVSSLKKSNHEIEELKMVDYDKVERYDPVFFNKQFSFIVHLEVSFNNKHQLKGSVDYYTELINTVFKMIHQYNDNVRFNIVKFTVPPTRDYHSQEEFFNLFGIYKYESSDFRK